MTIYSFDEVLRQRKMVHSVQVTPGSADKIPLWRPVSWAAIMYFAVVELVFVLAAKVPVLKTPYVLVSEFFSPAVYYALPVGVVWLALNAALDGRSPHRWALSYLLFLARPKRTVAGRTVKHAGEKTRYAGKVSVWWDLHAPRLHRGWVRGGRVTTSVPVRFTHALRHRHQVMVGDGTRNVAVEHEVEGKLQVRP